MTGSVNLDSGLSWYVLMIIPYQGRPFFHWLTDIRSQYIRH